MGFSRWGLKNPQSPTSCRQGDRRHWGRALPALNLFFSQEQLGLNSEPKWKLPGRGSGFGTYERTLNLLSSDPCYADLPRTPRAFGHLALNPRGAALPLLRRLWLKGLHSHHLAKCRQNSRLGIQRLLRRFAGLRLQKTRGTSATRTLRRSQLLLCPPGARGTAPCSRSHSAAPGAGPGGPPR